MSIISEALKELKEEVTIDSTDTNSVIDAEIETINKVEDEIQELATMVKNFKDSFPRLSYGYGLSLEDFQTVLGEEDGKTTYDSYMQAEKTAQDIWKEMEEIRSKYIKVHTVWRADGPDDCYKDYEEEVIDPEGLEQAKPKIDELNKRYFELKGANNQLYNKLKELAKQNRLDAESEFDLKGKEAALKSKKNQKQELMNNTEFGKFVREEYPNAIISIVKEADGIHYYAEFNREIAADDLDVEVDSDDDVRVNEDRELESFIDDLYSSFYLEEDADDTIKYAVLPEPVDSSAESTVEVTNSWHYPQTWDEPEDSGYDLGGELSLSATLEFKKIN